MLELEASARVFPGIILGDRHHALARKGPKTEALEVGTPVRLVEVDAAGDRTGRIVDRVVITLDYGPDEKGAGHEGLAPSAILIGFGKP